MREKKQTLLTVHELANICGVRRSAILQRIAVLRKHRPEIKRFLYAKHEKNKKLYFGKFIAKMILNSFTYKKAKSTNIKNLVKLTKSQAETIKILKNNNEFLKNQNYYITHYKM